MLREPIVAGQFYSSSPEACREELEQCIAGARADQTTRSRLYGGIVPHAGWRCSGAVTSGVFEALSESNEPETIVLLGAVHRARITRSGTQARAKARRRERRAGRYRRLARPHKEAAATKGRSAPRDESALFPVRESGRPRPCHPVGRR